MSDEPTLKQYNFLKSKGKWVDGMTKQEAHAAIAEIIPPKPVQPTVSGGSEYNSASAIPSGPLVVQPETIPHPKNGYQKDYEKPAKTYELTDGNIRIGALNTASRNCHYTDDAFWSIVKEFEDYIRNGK